MDNPVTPLQFRTGDIQTGNPVALQNLNTFLRQAVQTAFAALFGGPGWVKVTQFANGWGVRQGDVLQYAQLANGQVVFSGAVMGGTLTKPAFNLPKALWPSQDKNLAVNSNGAYGKLTIQAADGGVVPSVGDATSFFLDGAWFFPGT
jgi:hypothetical protein